MTAAASLTIVMVSFNTRQLTLECLRSLVPQLPTVNGQVVVVDNDSTDASVAAIVGEFPEVTVIVNPRNLGFGAANNLGFSKSDSEYVLLLNTDTLVTPNALIPLIEVLEREPTVGAVGCRLENSDGTLQRSCWNFPTPLRAWAEALWLNRIGLLQDWHRWNHASEQDVDFVIGAALLVRRKVIKEVGGFDEDFFLYAEEADWQRRMSQAGWRVRFTPNCTIVHLGGGSSSVMRDRQLVESCRGTSRYIRKHHGRIGFEIFRAGVIFGTSSRVFILAVQSLINRGAKQRLVELARTLRWWCGFGPRHGFRELTLVTESSK